MNSFRRDGNQNSLKNFLEFLPLVSDGANSKKQQLLIFTRANLENKQHRKKIFPVPAQENIAVRFFKSNSKSFSEVTAFLITKSLWLNNILPILSIATQLL